MKHAIVSGAAGSLGTAMAKMLLERGYRVTGIVNERGSGLPLTEVAIDLRDAASVSEKIGQVIDRQGHPEVAVMTVGSFVTGNLQTTTAAAVSEQLDTNFFSAYNLVVPVLAGMKQAGRGRIFLTGSLAGEDPRTSKDIIAYGLSKNLLFALADMLNAETSKTDIHTTVLVPSIIDTPQNRRSMPDADWTRWVTPEQIAAAVGDHLSESGWMLRNRVLRVTGGL